MAFGYTVLALVLGASLISALPRVVVTPNELLYSGRDVGNSSCSQLTLDKAKKLPGWPQIVQYAKDTYGDDGLTYKLNPKEHLDYPATICIYQQPIPISMQAPPSCTTSTASITGTINGTTGTVNLSQIYSYAGTGSWSITQSSSLAVGESFSALIGIPEVMDLTTAVTTTATFGNDISTGFKTTMNSQTTLSSSMNVGDNKKCTGTLTTTSCTGSGTGTVQYVASGSVWFYYDKKRPPKSQPKAEGHYQWAIPLEDVIKNMDDRSSSMKFTGVMQMDSHSIFSDSCVPL